MQIIRVIELDEQDVNTLIDTINNVFNVEVTEPQLEKLLTLCPDWDGIVDTLGRGDVIDSICQHFIGMDVPMYGSPQEYKDTFYDQIERSKKHFLEFIGI